MHFSIIHSHRKNTDNTKLQTAGKIITAINAEIKVVMQKKLKLTRLGIIAQSNPKMMRTISKTRSPPLNIVKSH